MDILNWNAVALEANRVSHTNGKSKQTGPMLSSRALAIVHLAMFDTHAAMKNNVATWPTYLPLIPNAPANNAANRKLAMAGAAFTALNALFPSQKEYFAERLHVLGGDKETAQHKYGEKVAKAILNDRKGDPGANTGSYIPKNKRNAHQPDPDNPTQGFMPPYTERLLKGLPLQNGTKLHHRPMMHQPIQPPRSRFIRKPLNRYGIKE